MKSLEQYVIYSLKSGYLKAMVISGGTDCPYFTDDQNQAKTYKALKPAQAMASRVGNSVVIDLIGAARVVDP